MIIHPYKLGSRSSRRLKEALNIGAGYKMCHVLQRAPKRSKASLVVNWGASNIEYPVGNHKVINPPEEVRVMSDKILFFERVGHDKNFLEWTRDRSMASEWGVKSKIFVRHLTRGSGGRGIDVWEAGRGEIIPLAPLYTKHQAKTHEYRVHVARGYATEGSSDVFKPLLVQRKVWKDVGVQPKTWDVRSHDNGFIFQSYPDTALDKVPSTVFSVVQKAMATYFPRMHFAAMDVLYHKPSDTAVICEGNTAPGMEGNTIDIYATYLTDLNADYQREKNRLNRERYVNGYDSRAF